MREYFELKAKEFKVYEKNITSLKEKYEEDLKKINNNRPVIDDVLISTVFKAISKEKIFKNLIFDKIAHQCREAYEARNPDYDDDNSIGFSSEPIYIYKLGMPYGGTKYNSFISNCVDTTMLTKILQDDIKFHISTNEDICYIEFRTIYHQYNQNNSYKTEYGEEDFDFQAIGTIKIDKLLDFFIEANKK